MFCSSMTSFLVIRPHILVKSAETVGPGTDLDVEVDVNESDHLQRLLEGLLLADSSGTTRQILQW